MSAPSPEHPKIRLIVVWSGNLPNYFPIFLGTAARNRTIDFAVFSDAKAPDRLPENVQWFCGSHAERVAQMGQQLDCNLDHVAPFKLCDLRPAFGVAFSEALAGYDFWGSIDCDTVLGDLRAFATDQRLNQFDILSFKGRGFIHGPLTLWRNCDRINGLYREADWRRVFAAEEYLGFDETGKRWGGDRLPRSVAERLARNEVPCISDIVYKTAETGRVTVYDGDHIVETKPLKQVPFLAMTWKHGRLRNSVDGRPLAFFHIHWAKSDANRGDPEFQLPSWDWERFPDCFKITRRRIGAGNLEFSRALLKARTERQLSKLRARLSRNHPRIYSRLVNAVR